jgi:plastocyanin
MRRAHRLQISRSPIYVSNLAIFAEKLSTKMRDVMMATLIVLGAVLALSEAQIDDGGDTDDIADCQSDEECTGEWICVGIGICVPPADSGYAPMRGTRGGSSHIYNRLASKEGPGVGILHEDVDGGRTSAAYAACHADATADTNCASPLRYARATPLQAGLVKEWEALRGWNPDLPHLTLQAGHGQHISVLRSWKSKTENSNQVPESSVSRFGLPSDGTADPMGNGAPINAVINNLHNNGAFLPWHRGYVQGEEATDAPHPNGAFLPWHRGYKFECACLWTAPASTNDGYVSTGRPPLNGKDDCTDADCAGCDDGICSLIGDACQCVIQHEPKGDLDSDCSCVTNSQTAVGVAGLDVGPINLNPGDTYIPGETYIPGNDNAYACSCLYTTAEGPQAGAAQRLPINLVRAGTANIADCQSDGDCTGDWICVGIGICVPPARPRNRRQAETSTEQCDCLWEMPKSTGKTTNKLGINRAGDVVTTTGFAEPLDTCSIHTNREQHLTEQTSLIAVVIITAFGKCGNGGRFTCTTSNCTGVAPPAIDTTHTTHTVPWSSRTVAGASITINIGDTVKWTGAGYDVVSGSSWGNPDGEFSSNGLLSGLRPAGEWSHTFSAVGEYSYYSSPHSYMMATITVEDDSADRWGCQEWCRCFREYTKDHYARHGDSDDTACECTTAGNSITWTRPTPPVQECRPGYRIDPRPSPDRGCVAPPQRSDCADGTDFVNCFVAPCSNSDCPGVTDAVCTNNYCGGCNALWHAPDGTLISDSACAGTPQRRRQLLTDRTDVHHPTGPNNRRGCTEPRGVIGQTFERYSADRDTCTTFV